MVVACFVMKLSSIDEASAQTAGRRPSFASPGGVGWGGGVGSLLVVGVSAVEVKLRSKDGFVSCVTLKINFHLNLIFKIQSLQTVERFLKFVLVIFPAKVLSSFVLTGWELS